MSEDFTGFHLNIDLCSEILKHLELVDSISLILTQSEFFSAASLWRFALTKRSNSGFISYPRGCNVSSLDLFELRRVAFKTAALYTNWESSNPRWKREKSFTVGPPVQRLLYIIPGTNIAFTKSEEMDTLSFFFNDMETGIALASIDFPGVLWLNQLPDPYDVAPGILDFPVVSERPDEEPGRVIWILRLDYRDRSATSVRIAREITLDGPNFEFEDFKVHISPTLIMPVFNSDVGDALFLTSIPKPHGSDDPLHVSLPIRVPLQVLPFESTDPNLHFELLGSMLSGTILHLIFRIVHHPISLFTASMDITKTLEKLKLTEYLFHDGIRPVHLSLRGVYDMFLSPYRSALVLVHARNLIYCPFEVVSGQIRLATGSRNFIPLHPPGEEGNPVISAFGKLYSYRTTYGKEGQAEAMDLVFMEGDAEDGEPRWTSRRLKLPEAVMSAVKFDTVTIEIDEHRGSLMIWDGSTTPNKVHLLDYV